MDNLNEPLTETEKINVLKRNYALSDDEVKQFYSFFNKIPISKNGFSSTGEWRQFKCKAYLEWQEYKKQHGPHFALPERGKTISPNIKKTYL